MRFAMREDYGSDRWLIIELRSRRPFATARVQDRRQRAIRASQATSLAFARFGATVARVGLAMQALNPLLPDESATAE